MWVAPVVVLAHAGSNVVRWCCCQRDEVAVVADVAAAVGLLVAQPWLLLAVAEAEGAADVLEEVEQELRALSVRSPRRGCCFACAL